MDGVLEIEARDWDGEVLKSRVLTAVEFWANHCPWCLRLNSIIDQVAMEYKDRIRFARIDVTSDRDNLDLAIRRGIMSTPVLEFFYRGRHIETVVGFIPPEHIRHVLDEVLEMHKDRARQRSVLKTLREQIAHAPEYEKTD